MERFKEAIYKQRVEIHERMMEVFSLLREYTKGKSPKKVLVREEVGKPVTKYINTISFVRVEDDKGKEGDKVINKNVVEPIELVEKEKVVDEVEDNEWDESMNEDSTRWGKYTNRLREMPKSRSIGYYLKHENNNKTIEDLVNNHKYSDFLLATRLGKMENETYKSLPVGPMNDMILKKKLARKDKREGNFVILTNEKPIETNIRLSLANHSYVYPLGIAEDMLVDVAGFVYPMDFVILDIKENDYMFVILGTLYLTTGRAEIKCDKGSMTLKAGKFKVRFVRTLRFPSKIMEK
ncbi:MAK10-like protein [Tanacetum coccineum]